MTHANSTLRRGRLLSLVPVVCLVLSASLAAHAGDILECRKGAAPPEQAALVAKKIFPDELPRESAIELARARGRRSARGDSVHLLALRVEFPRDNDSKSTGDGTFNYAEGDTTTFDRPPHDREYFELHMTALKNYYESVSYDRLKIGFTVAPAGSSTAYVLPHEMGYYHDYSDEQVWYVSQVEEFTRDAFAAADTTDVIDFSQYDGFILFHAGADWQSDVYLDSPYDLPSAHISLGEPILVNDGTVEVWGAAIMPETSSQDGLTIVLNGTLAHEVGHILGMPDLYNTRNFFPAVGYWDIMDSGGRIGMNTPWGWAYGLIPAAPCAWTKEFMGWLDPVTVSSDTTNVRVRASVLRGPGQRLYKIPLTSTEYFLLENRLDDIGNDLTVAIDQEQGVVLGPVDQITLEINHEYDFLLPGPGLMIYHIDDTRVIPGLLPWDTVNADQNRRGVAVEEADGIMDLGNISSFYWSGSKYDPFYAANNDSFAWDTYPDTETNAGGNSYVGVTNISEAPAASMSFNVSFAWRKTGWPKELDDPIGAIAPRVGDIDGDGLGEVVVATRSGNVYAWNDDGSPVTTGRTDSAPGLFAVAHGGVSYAPALADLDADGDLEVIVAADGGSLYVWDHSDGDRDGLADTHEGVFPLDIRGPASAAPVASDVHGEAGHEIIAASRGGYLTVVTASGDPIGASPYSFGHLVLDDIDICVGNMDDDPSGEIVLSTTNTGWVVSINADGTPTSGWPVTAAGFSDGVAGVVLGDLDRGSDGASEVIAAGEGGMIHAWDRAGNELPGWPVNIGMRIRSRPALADIDGDGYLEVVVPASDHTTLGFRMNGSRVENWPLEYDPGDSARVATCSPLLGDIDADGDVDVLLGGIGGNVFLWDGVTGRELPGWPLASDPVLGAPWLGDVDDDGWTDLLVAGSSGVVALLGLPYSHSATALIWPTSAGSVSGTGAYPDSLLPSAPLESPGLLADRRTYCYPNPAKGTDLTVRVYLEETATIDINIFDVAGERVDRIVAHGMPTANEIVWDTSSVASGFYIVKIDVIDPHSGGYTIGGGTPRTETKLIKVAVIN